MDDESGALPSAIPHNHKLGFIQIYSHASILHKSFHSLSLLIRSSSVSAITTMPACLVPVLNQDKMKWLRKEVSK